MKEPVISIRWMADYDLDKVVEFERDSYLKLDPDFQVMVTEDFAWNKKGFLECIRQYKKGNQNDTRALVAETVQVEDNGWGGETQIKKVVGSLIYEIISEGYDILHLTIDPNFDKKDKVRLALVGKVKEKLIKDEQKDKLTFYIPDGSWENIKFFRNQEWEYKLVRNPKGNDSWLFQHQIKDKKSPGNKQLA